MTTYTAQDLAYAKGTSEPAREAMLAMQTRITTLEAALRQAVEALNDTAYRLEQSRIWGGMEWSYHPMHPVKYLPLRDKARETAIIAKQALGDA